MAPRSQASPTARVARQVLRYRENCAQVVPATLDKIEAPTSPTSFGGVNEAYAIQAGREVRVMVDAKRVGDDEAYFIAKKIAERVSAEMTFPGEIKVTVLRETRAIEFAR